MNGSVAEKSGQWVLPEGAGRLPIVKPLVNQLLFISVFREDNGACVFVFCYKILTQNSELRDRLIIHIASNYFLSLSYCP